MGSHFGSAREEKYPRRRWLERLGEEIARNMGGGDG
jgi:hypothetical protein